MRRVTRNFIIALLVGLGILLSLGALPGYVQTGDPYHLEATVAAEDGPAVDFENLSDRRFPYTFEALSAHGMADATSETTTGRSSAYYAGPLGIKEWFTHTPFDEFGEYETRSTNAVDRHSDGLDGDVAYVSADGVRYRIEIVYSAEGSAT